MVVFKSTTSRVSSHEQHGSGYDLNCGLTFAGVFGDVYTKLYNVARQKLTGRTFLRTTTQSLAVDESSIAALGVLEVKLEPDQTRLG